MGTQSYKLSQTYLYFGTDTEILDLRQALDGPFGLAGVTSIDRRRTLTATRGGITADGISAGFTASCTLRSGTEARKLRATREGRLVIARLDAQYGYGIPVIVTATPITSPAGGALTMAVSFTQHIMGDAIAGPLDTEGSFAVSSGEQAYVVDPGSGITVVTTGGTVPNGGVVVIGTPVIAEGS